MYIDTYQLIVDPGIGTLGWLDASWDGMAILAQIRGFMAAILTLEVHTVFKSHGVTAPLLPVRTFSVPKNCKTLKSDMGISRVSFGR
jgi:hypothetical protein